MKKVVSQEPTRDRTVGTALHVCQILDCFTLARPTLTLTEITRELGLQKSSVYRLLQTLVAGGYLECSTVGRRYALGKRLAAVADVFAQTTSLAWIARPFLEALRDQTLESAAIQLREGNERYCLVECASQQLISLTLKENFRYPITTGASGLILRAYGPDWMKDPRHADLARVRADGYAIVHADLVPGALGIYVPLFARDDKLIATIGIQGPEYRINQRAVERFIGLLLAAAAEMKPMLDSNLRLKR